jgi:hypothetical protein
LLARASIRLSVSGDFRKFRELHSDDAQRSLALKFLAGKSIEIEDVERGTKRTVSVAPDGAVPFDIDQPAGYRFLRYTVGARPKP